MNINFTSVKWKNLLSYGNTFTTYDFKKGLDLISSENGNGKSSLMEATFYGLFGKPYRKIKNSSLINDINKKNLLVEIYFNIGEENNIINYMIKRGQKKNIFIIYKKEKDEYIEIPEKATTREYQIFLEEEILKLNDTVFRQLISISSNLDSSKNFMDLTQKEKESLFQVITDTSIFNNLSDKIKLRLQDTKLKQKDIEYQLNIIESSIESEKIMIEQAKKQNEDFKKHHNDNIVHTKENIESAENNIIKYTKGIEKLKELKELYNDLNNELTQNKQELINLNVEAQCISEEELQEMHNIYDNDSKTLDNWYYSLEYEEKDKKEQLHEIIIKNTEDISILNTKITHIEAAKKGSIKCKSCNTVNYLVPILEDDISSLDNLIEEKNNLIQKNKELVLNIDEIDQVISNKKEQNKIIFNNKKTNLLETRNNQQKILKEKNYSYKRKERDELQDKIYSIESTLEKYKEKLLKSKHIKLTLKENEDLLSYYKEKLKELNNIDTIDINEMPLKEKEKNRAKIKENSLKENKKLQDLNYLYNMISDKGENNLKGQVIARTVPFLNKGINYFLERFSLNEFGFIIDESFKEKIISRENNTEYNSLSNGQKMRISFSILFSFLRLIEEKNGVSTNILFLDEILDGSLDASGREELLYILKNEFSNKKDVIIISHNSEIKEKVEVFDRTISISKDKFSILKIEEIK